MTNKEEVWKAVLAELELSISKPSFATWFKETTIADISGGVVTISVPNGFAKDWLQNKYQRSIVQALRNISGDIREVTYVVGRSVGQAMASKRREHPQPIRPNLGVDERLEWRELATDPETGLNPRYLFEHFVVGSFNEIANAAAQAVVKNLGGTYNPLFIYGGVGLGKTHLIQAIGNEVVKTNPRLRVRYTPSEKYMGEIVDAINQKTMNQLKERYRAVDLLIMDDIQFMARTEKMQEEFFHTFNSLYEKNKQIVISSDKPPAAIPTLESRLRSRFEGGMIADIGEPDLETRLVILKKKLESKSFSMPEPVLRYVAETVKSNIRELEGALNRLILHTKMTALPLEVEDAKKVLAQVQAGQKRFATPKKIIRAVADFYEISERELMNQSRKREIVRPRQIAMFLLREELKCSFPFIGERLGKKDHTTAIHGFKKVLGELKQSHELEDELKIIKERIYSMGSA